MLRSKSLLLILTLLASAFSGEVYKHMNFTAMEDYLRTLALKYPNLMHLETAQEKYAVPYANCSPSVCPVYIVTLTEFATYSPDRPQVFLSGAVHGNEVIGPNAVSYLAGYLLRGYGNDRWLTHMLQTRVIVILPAANAQGYMDDMREERVGKRSFDPNRDFPYDQDETTCMNTVVARSILKVFRDHMFVLGITFHGGDNCIAYEWGSNNHKNKSGGAQECPDDFAMFQVGELMKAEAGEVQSHGIPQYELGRMTDLVYAVGGGMEDWAYAASWAHSLENGTLKAKCDSSTYGGFDDRELDMKNNVRFPLYLVEAGQNKHPDDNTFGTEEGILLRNSTYDGHIPRNIRMSLALIDLAKPYVRDVDVGMHNCTHAKITWKVAGALYVNDTYVEWEHLTNNLTGQYSVPHRTEKQVGKSAWLAPNASFTAYLPIAQNSTKVSARIVAVTDLQWGVQVAPVPNVVPLTHFVKLRLEPRYLTPENVALIYSASNAAYSSQLVVVSVPPEREEKGSVGVPLSVFVAIVTLASAAAVLVPIVVWLYFRQKYRNYEPMDRLNISASAA